MDLCIGDIIHFQFPINRKFTSCLASGLRSFGNTIFESAQKRYQTCLTNNVNTAKTNHTAIVLAYCPKNVPEKITSKISIGQLQYPELS